jgi:hypothetical protein
VILDYQFDTETLHYLSSPIDKEAVQKEVNINILMISKK